LSANQVSLSNFGQNAGTVTDELSSSQLSQVQAQCEQLLALLNSKTLSNPLGHAFSSHHQAAINKVSSSTFPVSSITGILLCSFVWSNSHYNPNFLTQFSHLISHHTPPLKKIFGFLILELQIIWCILFLV
jgi:hypothetical protein